MASISDQEASQIHEWIQRMQKKEPGLVRKELPGKVLLVDGERLHRLSRERLEAQVEKGLLILEAEIGSIHLYKYKEID